MKIPLPLIIILSSYFISPVLFVQCLTAFFITVPIYANYFDENDQSDENE